MYFYVVQKFPAIIAIEEQISYPGLQKLYAIVQSCNDYEAASYEAERPEE